MKATLTLFALAVIFSVCTAQVVKIPLIAVREEDVQEMTERGDKTRFLSASQSLVNTNKLYYYGNVKLGQQSKTFTMIFDTTGSSAWVPNPGCASNNKCNGFNTTYDCGNDISCQSIGKTGSFNYANNAVVSGSYVNTTVGIAGLDKVTVSILSADSVSNLSFLKSDGIFGLQMYDDVSYQGDSYVTRLFQSGQISEKMFSLYLGFKRDDSEITFGGYDSSKLKNSQAITYHSVVQTSIQKNSQQRWAVKASSVSIGKVNIGYPAPNNIALVSSLDAYLVFSPGTFNSIINLFTDQYKLTKSNNAYFLDCKQNLPDLFISLYDSSNNIVQLNISAPYYVNNQTLSCQLMFSSLPTSDSNQVLTLGSPFLRKYLSIFNLANQTIGFSESIADPNDDYTKIEGWVIAVIVVAVVLVAAAIGGSIWWKKRKNRQNQQNLQQNFIANNGYQQPSHQYQAPQYNQNQYQQPPTYPPAIN